MLTKEMIEEKRKKNIASYEAASIQMEEEEAKILRKLLELRSMIEERNKNIKVRFDKREVIDKVSRFLYETL